MVGCHIAQGFAFLLFCCACALVCSQALKLFVGTISCLCGVATIFQELGVNMSLKCAFRNVYGVKYDVSQLLDISVSVLADVSVRSPRKLIVFVCRQKKLLG